MDVSTIELKTVVHISCDGIQPTELKALSKMGVPVDGRRWLFAMVAIMWRHTLVFARQPVDSMTNGYSCDAVDHWLESYNKGLRWHYRRQALVEWEQSVTAIVSTDDAAVAAAKARSSEVTLQKARWMQQTREEAESFVKNCASFWLDEDNGSGLTSDDEDRARMLALIRRGPKFQPEAAGKAKELVEHLTSWRTKRNAEGGSRKFRSRWNTSLSADEQLLAWEAAMEPVNDGYSHQQSPRKAARNYTKLVHLMNEGARAAGAGYDSIADAWQEEDEVDNLEGTAKRLYMEIEPFYQELHAYVRYKLGQTYGDDIVPKNGPIPVYLLGDLWGQNWQRVFSLVKPYSEAPDIDLTSLLGERFHLLDLLNPTQELENSMKGPLESPTLKLYKLAENFFQSIGLRKMTDTFWKKSMLVKPSVRLKSIFKGDAEETFEATSAGVQDEGNSMDCHAIAMDMFDEAGEDFRIKFCAELDAESFWTIHHEMGHIQYFMAYKDLPTILRAGANPSFHEAIGDSMLFSAVRPEYLAKIGLLPAEDLPKYLTPDAEINFLMKQALSKVPLLGFALAMEDWRWSVFKGQVAEKDYNKAWWENVLRYQGLKPPSRRTSAQFFDPGMKFHIAASIPYIRYFFAGFMQFQFHDGYCGLRREGGNSDPLYKCQIYGEKRVGHVLETVLSKGRKFEWEKIFRYLTGWEGVSSDALLDYFKDLHVWLVKQRSAKNYTISWQH